MARKHGGVNPRKFDEEKRLFIIKNFQNYPTSFLDEVRRKFIKEYQINISCSTIWRIIDEAGFTRKVIERRAIEISVVDICRYFNDLQSLPCICNYKYFLMKLDLIIVTYFESVNMQ